MWTDWLKAEAHRFDSIEFDLLFLFRFLFLFLFIFLSLLFPSVIYIKKTENQNPNQRRMGGAASLGEQFSKSKYKKAPKIIISDFGGTKEGKLSFLPAQIGGLRNCEYFDASENVISKIPKEIGKMCRLK